MLVERCSLLLCVSNGPPRSTAYITNSSVLAMPYKHCRKSWILPDDDPEGRDKFGRQAGSQQQPHPRDSRGGRSSQNQQQLARPRDPFAAMEQRMSQMMGGGGMMMPSGGGFGMFGGDPFGDMQSSSMSSMISSSRGGGGGGSFSSSSTMVYSSKMGPDGKMHTERFSSSAVRDGQRDAFEQQQAYSNSSTGVDKMSMERQHQNRGRKMVKEYSHATGEDRQTEFLRGLEDHEKSAFDAQWHQEVAPHLPRHGRMSMPAMSGGSALPQGPSSRSLLGGNGAGARRSENVTSSRRGGGRGGPALEYR
ncbi:unnamed protein product [Amoebophrya sp. A120]|nr:unnamed protein product [Amoebophrya sp. A120]|eukprot:GSA120T00017152001.1